MSVRDAMPTDRFTTTLERYDYNRLQISVRKFNALIKVVVKLLTETVPILQTKEHTQLQSNQRQAERTDWKPYEKDKSGNVSMPLW